jgi:tetratricopeptide (TPR) repeat protein
MAFCRVAVVEHGRWQQQLQLLQAQGRFEELRLALAEAQAAMPDSAPLQCYVGWQLRGLGELQAALAALAEAVRLQPEFTLAHVRLGVVLRDLGRLAEAEQATRRALQLDPASAGSWMNLAVILKDVCRLREAVAAIDRALELEPLLPGAALNQASILRDLGQPQAALQVLAAARLSQGESPALLALEGALFQAQGRFAEAEASLRRALALDPGCSQAYLSLVQQCKASPDDPLDQGLRQALAQPRLPASARCDLLFARAKVDHDLGRFAQAAEALQQANQLKQALRPSNAASVLEQGERLWQQFCAAAAADQSQLDSLPPDGPGAGCVFVVGMPRSGSTLVETILSLNSACVALGEVDWFPQAYRQVAESASGPALFAQVAERYLRARATRQPDAAGWSVDKLLSNYQYCGQILRALPQARILHCRRHPLDVLLSIYRANFSVGLGYASSLTDAARVLAQQATLMERYAALFPDRIRVCDYEALVREPEHTVRGLVHWLGWPWDDRYLQPQHNRRSVSTASVVQVRAPIHAGSVGNWQRYAALLEPARRELERLGVAVGVALM